MDEPRMESRPASPGRAAPRILLAVAAILVSLAAVEGAYRVKLRFDLQRKTRSPTFRIYREPLYEYDPVAGYRYAPGRDVFYCDVTSGALRGCGAVKVDALGNIDSGMPAPRSPVRVLVFGDSFSANPNQPSGWPLYFAEKSGFEVINFARDGYGMLQMFDLAAARVREFKPDFIIVAFIAEDLWRARTWRSTVDPGGGPVTTVASEPAANGDPGAPECGLVDPEISPDWCDRLRAAGGTDPLFARLERRYRDVVRRRFNSFLYDPGHSLVLSRLLHGDPFAELRGAEFRPYTEITDFARDSAFVRDVRAVDVPMILVLLPRYPDIAAGRTILGRQGAALLASLIRITGTSPVDVAQGLETDGVDVRSWYLLPEDDHPSPAGSAAFAGAIWRFVAPLVPSSAEH